MAFTDNTASVVVGSTRDGVLMSDNSTSVSLESPEGKATDFVVGGANSLSIQTRERGVVAEDPSGAVVVQETGTVGEAEVLLSDGSQVMALYAPPGGGSGQLPRVYGLKPVEAYEYSPYGVPTIHSREADGSAQLRVWDEAKVSVRAANGTLSSNAREGVAAGALLAPAVRTTQSVRAPLSAAQSSIGLKFLFTARPWTPVGEVYHLRARWYSPLEGRFLTMDPIGYDGGYNVYMYCGGDPVNWRDPWGLKKYLFYVFVRQPGEGGDRDAFETSQAEDGRVSVDPGHVFVKVYGDGELVGPIGFYPKCDGAAALGGCPGELKEDTDTNFDVEVTFEIDRCDFEETKKYIEEKQAVPPYSHPLDYNCVHFAVDCAKQAGVQLPQSQTEVRSWLLRGAFFLNTGDLGEDLRTRKQYPAGPQIPVFGIIPIQD